LPLLPPLAFLGYFRCCSDVLQVVLRFVVKFVSGRGSRYGRYMGIIGFGASSDHPRANLEMVDDSFLKIGSKGVDADIARMRLQGGASDNSDVVRSYLLGPQRLEAAAISPGEEAAVFHVAHSSQLGWVVDVHDSVDSVVEVINATLEHDRGPLRLHGEYVTDGESVYLGAKAIARLSDVQITSDQLPDLPGVADWRVLHPQKIGIVGLLIVELSVDALISYRAVAKITGVGASTLRAYVSRYEGRQVPFRQGSTETGQPVWSRPVIDEWNHRRFKGSGDDE